MSNFDLVTAMWMRKKQKNTVILKDTPPLSFKASSTKLKDYAIYGNDGGVGDYDESTGKYHIPITVRRKNIFDFRNYDLVALYPDSATGTATASREANRTARSFVIPVTPGKTYCFSARRGVYNRFRLAGYEGLPADGAEGSEPLTARSTGDGNYGYIIFTVPINVNYVLAFMFRDLSDEEIADLVTSEALELLVIESSNLITYYKSTITISVDEPLGEDEYITMSDTGQQIDVIKGENTLTVDTTIQPAKVTIKYYGGGL